ncbi:MAG: hypothetical protein U5L95_02965 [Candidatus Saccharibacteria bacterium]|nr:hypothetical protein [Candidatus Saccharibacteria bacterium]
MSKHVFDEAAWASHSVFWQLGNIGSEVGRALNGKRKGNERRMTTAFHRGMDLINATVRAWAAQGKDPYELLIAREQFANSILTDNVDHSLEKYFMDFAIAARSKKS